MSCCAPGTPTRCEREQLCSFSTTRVCRCHFFPMSSGRWQPTGHQACWPRVTRLCPPGLWAAHWVQCILHSPTHRPAGIAHGLSTKQLLTPLLGNLPWCLRLSGSSVLTCPISICFPLSFWQMLCACRDYKNVFCVQLFIRQRFLQKPTLCQVPCWFLGSWC